MLEALERLLTLLAFGPVRELVPLGGAGNNQVFKVITSRHTVLAKRYFRHPGDPRDRLAVEFGFLEFAWRQGIAQVPQPLVCDREAGLALYEFLEGEPVTQMGGDYLEQAKDFYLALNRSEGRVAGAHLPPASEACLTLSDYIQAVEKRLPRLCALEAETPEHRRCREFVQDALLPAWQGLLRTFEAAVARAGRDPDEVLDRGCWRLSPSDFGLHNAVLTPGRRLRFVDFEYAGWDDPAKMLCDFFCQPRVPVPRSSPSSSHWISFLDAVAADAGAHDQALRTRVELVWPLCRIKWCCLMLNHFLPTDGDRRRFSARGVISRSALNAQLEMAQAALAKVDPG